MEHREKKRRPRRDRREKAHPEERENTRGRSAFPAAILALLLGIRLFFRGLFLSRPESGESSVRQDENDAGRMIRRRVFLRRWKRVMLALAAVMVFITTYNLILPAITLERPLLCGQEEHSHSASCTTMMQVLTCGQVSSGSHSHSDACYSNEPILTCGKNEHVHSETCYAAQSTAGVETKEDWAEQFKDVELAGTAGERLVTIARTQLGYQENQENFIVTEIGDVHGYTRYGGWMGLPYSNWNASFVSFCLEYAGINEQTFPGHKGSSAAWAMELKGGQEQAGQTKRHNPQAPGEEQEVTIDIPDLDWTTGTKEVYWRDARDYTPKLGDLVFFNPTGNGVAERVGIVAELRYDDGSVKCVNDRSFTGEEVQEKAPAATNAGEPAAGPQQGAGAAVPDEHEDTRQSSDGVPAAPLPGEGGLAEPALISIVVIEGDSQNQVQAVMYPVNDPEISGYAALPEEIVEVPEQPEGPIEGEGKEEDQPSEAPAGPQVILPQGTTPGAPSVHSGGKEELLSRIRQATREELREQESLRGFAQGTFAGGVSVARLEVYSGANPQNYSYVSGDTIGVYAGLSMNESTAPLAGGVWEIRIPKRFVHNNDVGGYSNIYEETAISKYVSTTASKNHFSAGDLESATSKTILLEGDDIVVRYTLMELTGTSHIDAPIVFRTNRGWIPDGTHIPITTRLLDADGNVIISTTDTRHVISTRETEFRKTASSTTYGGMEDLSNPGYFFASPEDVPPVSFSFRINISDGYRYYETYTITDTLPEGAVFLASDNPGWTYDQETRTASYTQSTPGEKNPGKGYSFTSGGGSVTYNLTVGELKLRFPGAAVNSTVTNNAEITLTQARQADTETDERHTASVSTTLIPYPKPRLYNGKSGQDVNLLDVPSNREKSLRYTVNANIFGTGAPTTWTTVALRDYDLDPTLSRLKFSSIELSFISPNLSGTLDVKVTRRNGTEETVATGISTVGTVVQLGEDVESFEVNLSPGSQFNCPATTSFSSTIRIYGFTVHTELKDKNVSPGTDYLYNSLQTTASYSYGGVSETLTLQSRGYNNFLPFDPRIAIDKRLNTGSLNTAVPGQEVSFLIYPYVNRFGYEDGVSTLRDLKIVDLIPVGSEYVAGSARVKNFAGPGESSNERAMEPQIVNNYKNSGRTALVWSFGDLVLTAAKLGSGFSSGSIIYNSIGSITYSLTCSNRMEEGSNRNPVYLSVSNQDEWGIYTASWPGVLSQESDRLDINENGSTTEQIPYSYQDFTFVPAHELIATKYARGDQDSVYLITPEYAQSEVDGSASYQLELWNNSTRDYSNIVILDLLPQPGDITAGTDQTTHARRERESTFAVSLTEPAAVDTGFTAWYTTADPSAYSDMAAYTTADIWREAASFSHDFSQVRAVKFVMDPGEVLRQNEKRFFTLAVKVPAGLSPEDAAVNSFGVATAASLNYGESNLMELRPIFYTVEGTVFLDKDRDGLYAAGTDGVYPNHLVELVDSGGSVVCDPQGEPYQARTDAQGHYEMTVHRNGTYRVRVVNPGQNSYTALTDHSDEKNGSHIPAETDYVGLSDPFTLDLSTPTAIRNAGYRQTAFDLTVSKEVEDPEDRDLPFSIEVSLTDENGDPVAPPAGTGYTVSGNTAALLLTHGSSVTIHGIQAGTVATVREVSHPGYHVHTLVNGGDRRYGDSRTVVLDNENQRVTVQNSRGSVIALKKTDQDTGAAITTGADFLLKRADTGQFLTADSPDLAWGARSAARTYTTGSGGTVILPVLPAGDYLLEEKRPPEGYYPRPELLPFEVTEEGGLGLGPVIDFDPDSTLQLVTVGRSANYANTLGTDYMRNQFQHNQSRYDGDIWTNARWTDIEKGELVIEFVINNYNKPAYLRSTLADCIEVDESGIQAFYSTSDPYRSDIGQPLSTAVWSLDESNQLTAGFYTGGASWSTGTYSVMLSVPATMKQTTTGWVPLASTNTFVWYRSAGWESSVTGDPTADIGSSSASYNWQPNYLARLASSGAGSSGALSLYDPGLANTVGLQVDNEPVPTYSLTVEKTVVGAELSEQRAEVTAAAGAALRSAPSAEGSVVTTAARESTLALLARYRAGTETWYQTTDGSNTGWVLASEVETDFDRFFPIQVTLESAAGTPIPPRAGTGYTLSGGAAVMELANGGSLTVPGIYGGTVATVRETDHEGCAVSYTPSDESDSAAVVTVTADCGVTVTNEPMAEITLQKVDSLTGAPLEGAAFQLKDSRDRWLALDQESGGVSWKTEASEAAVFTSGGSGLLTLPALGAGAYVLVETETPPGYTLVDRGEYDILVMANGTASVSQTIDTVKTVLDEDHYTSSNRVEAESNFDRLKTTDSTNNYNTSARPLGESDLHDRYQSNVRRATNSGMQRAGIALAEWGRNKQSTANFSNINAYVNSGGTESETQGIRSTIADGKLRLVYVLNFKDNSSGTNLGELQTLTVPLAENIRLDINDPAGDVIVYHTTGSNVLAIDNVNQDMFARRNPPFTDGGSARLLDGSQYTCVYDAQAHALTVTGIQHPDTGAVVVEILATMDGFTENGGWQDMTAAPATALYSGGTTLSIPSPKLARKGIEQTEPITTPLSTETVGGVTVFQVPNTPPKPDPSLRIVKTDESGQERSGAAFTLSASEGGGPAAPVAGTPQPGPEVRIQVAQAGWSGDPFLSIPEQVSITIDGEPCDNWSAEDEQLTLPSEQYGDIVFDYSVTANGSRSSAAFTCAAPAACVGNYFGAQESTRSLTSANTDPLTLPLPSAALLYTGLSREDTVYTLAETQAPGDYQISMEPFSFRFEDDGEGYTLRQVDGSGNAIEWDDQAGLLTLTPLGAGDPETLVILQVMDYPLGRLTLEKTDGWKESGDYTRLQDYAFTLEQVTADGNGGYSPVSSGYSDSQTTGRTGRLTFTGLPTGIYLLSENPTQAQRESHEPLSDAVLVTVNDQGAVTVNGPVNSADGSKLHWITADGDSVLYVDNEPLYPLTLRKFAPGTGPEAEPIPLDGAAFALVRNEDADTMRDSGIDYRDPLISVARNDYLTTGANYSTMDVLYKNPGRGFYWWPSTLTLSRSDSLNSAASPRSDKSSLLYLPVNLWDFSGAYHLDQNGERGEDMELTPAALSALDQTLKNVRNNNNQAILRFIYDKGNDGVQANEGYSYYEGSTKRQLIEPRQEMILRHIEQLAEVLNNNAEAIYTVQIGFYGSWGELHSSAMCTDSNIKGALTKLLEETRPSGLRISARTPSRYAHYLNINVADIESYPSAEGEDAYRIAIFNDGYLGTGNDWGTFYNRTREINWMSLQNLHNPYGGEAILDTNNQPAPVAQHDNVIREMPRTHTSYISHTWNQALHRYWASQPYTGDDPEYQGTNLFQYIEYHLGYRFVIRDSRLSQRVSKGGTLMNTYAVENVGFGNLIYPMKSYLYVLDENDNVVLTREAEVDPMTYATQETTTHTIQVTIPEELDTGEYRLYLQHKIGDRSVNGQTRPYGAIRFANRFMWNSTLEANYLGSFSVVDGPVDTAADLHTVGSDGALSGLTPGGTYDLPDSSGSPRFFTADSEGRITGLEPGLYQVKPAWAGSTRGGQLSFSDLKAGSYTLTETEAPDGYYRVPDITVTVGKGGRVTAQLPDGTPLPLGEDGQLLIQDLPYSGFELLKYGQVLNGSEVPANLAGPREGTRLLDGASFTLSGQPDDQSLAPVSQSGTTAADGRLTFHSLPPGSYTLTETTPPEGYVRIAPMTVTVDPYGGITVTAASGAPGDFSAGLLRVENDPGILVEKVWEPVDTVTKPVQVRLETRPLAVLLTRGTELSATSETEDPPSGGGEGAVVGSPWTANGVDYTILAELTLPTPPDGYNERAYLLRQEEPWLPVSGWETLSEDNDWQYVWTIDPAAQYLACPSLFQGAMDFEGDPVVCDLDAAALIDSYCLYRVRENPRGMEAYQTSYSANNTEGVSFGAVTVTNTSALPILLQKVEKVPAGKENDPLYPVGLSGAQFVLYRDEDVRVSVDNSGDSPRFTATPPSDPAKAISMEYCTAPALPGETAFLSAVGMYRSEAPLDPGIYWLHEREAPSGYTGLQRLVPIAVTGEAVTVDGTACFKVALPDESREKVPEGTNPDHLKYGDFTEALVSVQAPWDETAGRRFDPEDQGVLSYLQVENAPGRSSWRRTGPRTRTQSSL